MTTAVTPRPATGTKRSRGPKGLTAHVFLILAVLISVFPFVWTIVMATNTTRDIYKSPPKLTFGSHLLENVRGVLDTVDFFGSMLNTIVIACVTTVLVLFVGRVIAAQPTNAPRTDAHRSECARRQRSHAQRMSRPSSSITLCDITISER